MSEMSNQNQATSANTVVDLLSATTLAPLLAPSPSSISTATSTPPAPVASKLNFQEAQWTDIHEDDDGNAAGVFGVSWDEFSSKQLRAICSKLIIKNVRNAKKPEMIEKIVKTYKNRKAYSALLLDADSKQPAAEREKTATARKQIQCPFRLMNILFSDEFVEDFASLGNVANRQILDSGKAGNQQYFWERIAAAFTEPEETYGILRFVDDEVLAAHSHIDPSKIVPHEWKKLRLIWKSVNADYKAALTKFTQSGTHDHNFYSFCNGKVETYYLRKYLDLRPNTNATVEADLPDDCAVSSDHGTLTRSSVASSRKKRPVNDEIVDAIRELHTGNMTAAVAQKKLVYMESEETRRQQEQTWREKEESRREKEEVRLQDEHIQKKQRNLFEEWQKIQSNLKDLRHDIIHGSLDDVTKKEFEGDVEALVKRKKQLALELGFS